MRIMKWLCSYFCSEAKFPPTKTVGPVQPKQLNYSKLKLNFTAGKKDPIISDDEDKLLAPKGYCMVSSITLGKEGTTFEGVRMSNWGGATLLAGPKLGARYVLGCAHIPASVNENGVVHSDAIDYCISVMPSSRNNQPLVYSCNEVYIHSYYEGLDGNYRWDLSLSVLPECVGVHHAIGRKDMNLHAVKPGEILRYCGMGAKKGGKGHHQKIHVGKMRVTDMCLSHISKLEPFTDQFEQGFSGGPLYDVNNSSAWSGVISHYAFNKDGSRDSFIIPAQAALVWADNLINYLENK